MTQPTAEAYLAAWVAYEALAIAGRYDIQPIVDAVWPLAVAEGRQLERERLAPLVEAAKAWRAAWFTSEATKRAVHLRIAVDDALDALTRGDMP